MSTSQAAGSTSSLTARLGLTNWRQNIIYIGFVVIFIIFAVTLFDKGFLNPNNLLNIVRQTAMIARRDIARRRRMGPTDQGHAWNTVHEVAYGGGPAPLDLVR